MHGEIYLAMLDVQGSEQAGTRPAVIVSRNAINEHSSVVIVVPVTGREHKKTIYPSQVTLKAGEGGLTKDSVVLCEQVRAISKLRLRRRMGQLNAPRMKAIAEALKIALDFS